MVPASSQEFIYISACMFDLLDVLSPPLVGGILIHICGGLGAYVTGHGPLDMDHTITQCFQFSSERERERESVCVVSCNNTKKQLKIVANWFKATCQGQEVRKGIRL